MQNCFSVICISIATLFPLNSALATLLTLDDKNTEAVYSIQTGGEKEYQQGLVLLAEGRYVLAKQQFERSLQQNPTMAKALIALSEVEYKQNNLAQAKKYIREAVVLEPENAHVQASLARVLFVEGDIAGAEEAFLISVELQPTLVRSHVALGDLYMNQYRNPSKAEHSYRNALKFDEKHAGANYALGLALYSQGKISEAEEQLKYVVGIQPENPLPLFTLGNIYSENDDYENALNVYGLSLERQPKFYQAHVARADIYWQQGELKKAGDEYKSALQINDKLAFAHLKLGMLYHSQGNLADAEKSYKQAIEANSKLAIAYNNLASLKVEQNKDLDVALNWAKKALQLAPQSEDFKDTLKQVERVIALK